MPCRTAAQWATETVGFEMARPAGFEPATLGLAYHFRFRGPRGCEVRGLDYLFAVAGAARIVSTDPGARRFPRDCHRVRPGEVSPLQCGPLQRFAASCAGPFPLEAPMTRKADALSLELRAP